MFTSKSAVVAAALPFLVITITTLLSLTPSTASSHHQNHGIEKEFGFSTKLIHRDSPQSPLYNPDLIKSERIEAAVQRSHSRHRYLQSKFNRRITPNEPQPPAMPYYGDYIMNFSIGTPPVQTYAIIDTASDVTWLQCLPCEDCYPQTIPIFDSSKSSTYEMLECQDYRCSFASTYCGFKTHKCFYYINYADKSFSYGDLSLETLTLNDDVPSGQISLSNMIIGCGRDNSQKPLVPGVLNPPGIIGFNQEQVSFINQLQILHFSYCLVEINSNLSSRMHFQSEAVLFGGKTPLLDDQGMEVAYFLSLEGISVGSTRLPLPAGTFNSTGGDGGFAIDTGTPYTVLQPNATDMLINEMVKQIDNKVPRADPQKKFAPCYKTTLDVIKRVAPELIFHFNGLDLELNKVGTWVDVGQGIVCLAIVRASGNLTVFGNFQQQNMNIGYDLDKKIVSFLKVEDCDI